MIDNYSAGAGGGAQIESRLLRQTKLDVARSRLHIPVALLRTVNADITTSGLGSHGPIDVMQFDVP